MSLTDILSRIEAARARSGAGPVELIAVSKMQPLARIRAVLDQGHRLFGENRVQEAAGRWPALRADYPGITLHLIGPLQTNKVRQALELFDVIQTLDRDRLARKLADAAQARGACPPLFVQVNTGAEPQKAGILPESADAFIAAVRRDYQLPVVGLMCIPPVDQDPVPHFRLLRQIARRNGLAGLSMGMSADFETAIAEGATHVRIGSALFGDREAAG